MLVPPVESIGEYIHFSLVSLRCEKNSVIDILLRDLARFIYRPGKGFG